jgi:hypothetical protein
VDNAKKRTFFDGCTPRLDVNICGGVDRDRGRLHRHRRGLRRCAIAYRLAEAGHKVLVIEHGGTDAGPFIKMPAALSYPMSMARYDWGYRPSPSRIWTAAAWPARAAR